MSYLTRALGAAKLFGKAHAPTIMVVSGVTAMGASVIAASKQTLKVEETLEPHVAQLEILENNQADGYWSDREVQVRKSKIVARSTMDLSKLYAVPAVLFLGGAGLVFGGHHIMVKRNATLALAFTGLKKSFDLYRSNVRESFGDEADRAMLAGSKTRPILNEKGEIVDWENRLDWETAQNDPYNRVFARGESSQWIDDLGVNRMFVSQQQRNAQILVGNRGYLYLSEVYEALGFPETDISRVVGWKATINPDGSKSIPVIDFGLDKPIPDDWKYSANNEIYLDFNCSGLIIGGKVQKALERA